MNTGSSNPSPKIGPICPEHYDDFLRLNQKYVHFLAPMDRAEMEKLLSGASYARQIGDVHGKLSGILMGFLDTDVCEGENINWLRARYDKFAYIDRVIIDGTAHARGYGRMLYDDFENFAVQRHIPLLVCEVNTRPANPVSHQFHLNMGFVAIGEQDIKNGQARVRYYAKSLGV